MVVMSEQRISLDRLRVGVYVRLELRWIEHPFAFNSFKIKSENQIKVLKDLGISSVVYKPEKSDQPPLPPAEVGVPEALDVASVFKKPADADPILQKRKQERICRLKEQQRRFQKCEREFQKTFRQAKRVIKSLSTGSLEAKGEADSLLQTMVESLLTQRDVVINLMHVKSLNEDVFYHTLNVALLALLLGREVGLTEEELRWLGLGALFHDVGKQRIPRKYLIKRGPLTPIERKLLQLHPIYGEEIAKQIEDFPEESLKVIRQHHETNDGQGYPDRLKADEISLLAKVISIANTYDSLCNPLDPEEAMTPHEALSHMFCRIRDRFDENLLSRFIRVMGIYPPGSLVELSNGLIGMVISINPKDHLRPNILIYDPAVPKREAMIFELGDDQNVTIKRSLRPSQVQAEVYYYLNPRTPMDYFI